MKIQGAFSFSDKWFNEFLESVDHCDVQVDLRSMDVSLDEMKHKVVCSCKKFKREILKNMILLKKQKSDFYLTLIRDEVNGIKDLQISSPSATPEVKGRRMRIIIDGEEYSSPGAFDSFCKTVAEAKAELLQFVNKLLMENTNSNQPAQREYSAFQHEIRPIFDKGFADELVEKLSGYFSPPHLVLLEQLLRGLDSSEPLIFLGNGNKIADAFKQGYNAGMITGCEKKELESWIKRNFRYSFRGKIMEFTSYYLSKIISSKEDLCQNPILDVYKKRQPGKNKVRIVF